MKKFLFIVIVISFLIVSCKSHVYHTYYGDINTDTATVELQTKKSDYYIVYTNKDTIVFYSPSEDVYLMQFPTHDEHGNVVAKYNPYDNSLTGSW